MIVVNFKSTILNVEPYVNGSLFNNPYFKSTILNVELMTVHPDEDIVVNFKSTILNVERESLIWDFG